jgi:hypothetical protein
LIISQLLLSLELFKDISFTIELFFKSNDLRVPRLRLMDIITVDKNGRLRLKLGQQPLAILFRIRGIPMLISHIWLFENGPWLPLGLDCVIFVMALLCLFKLRKVILAKYGLAALFGVQEH